MTCLYDFSLTALAGAPLPLSRFRGQVVLLVNVASQCGLTPQYRGLERLQRVYGDQGLVVIGVPCNQFGGQEPGSPAAIQAFCEREYGVSFALTAKIDVTGPHQDPLFRWLEAESGGPMRWNFEKFLFDHRGQLVTRFHPQVASDDLELEDQIGQLLAQRGPRLAR